MTRFNAAGRSYLAVSDRDGTMRDLSPWLERISPLGRVLAGHRITGVNDAADRTVAGIEQAQDFTIAGRWDDAVPGPDATLAAVVGCAVTVDYGPAGRAPGQRRITGSFVCLSYRVASAAGRPVRFEAAFRQDGPVTLGHW